jgi:peptidyl-prolyl cis-trans isomerase B (cyclophilin B)
MSRLDRVGRGGFARTLALLAVLALLVIACGGSKPTAKPSVGPPSATPLANPPAQPVGSGVTATIVTDLGNIVIELYDGSSPVAAQNFINLASAGYYNGTTFHRLVPNFVIQGGDPKGDGTGGPGYTIQDEQVVGNYVRGTVAMARTQEANSAGSQFFIVLDDSVAGQLGRSYAIFGTVISGMDVVDKIAAMPNSGPPNNAATNPVVMKQVTIQQPSASPAASAPSTSGASSPAASAATSQSPAPSAP